MDQEPAHTLTNFELVYEFCSMFPEASAFTAHEKVRYLALRGELTLRADNCKVNLREAAVGPLMAALELDEANISGSAALKLQRRGEYLKAVEALSQRLEPVGTPA